MSLCTTDPRLTANLLHASLSTFGVGPLHSSNFLTCLPAGSRPFSEGRFLPIVMLLSQILLGWLIAKNRRITFFFLTLPEAKQINLLWRLLI